MQKTHTGLHRFSMLVVGATLCLIFIGGLVTTKDAGMSVPDWPTTFHYSMFSYPVAKWVSTDAVESGVFYEHSHRLFASLVGMLTTALAIWIWIADSRRWMKMLGLAAFLLVAAQGVLGGLRVAMSSVTFAMLHGCTAQAFLCVLVFISAALSPWWNAAPAAGENLRGIRRTAWLLVTVTYIQIVVGVIMRQLKAGLAIPTFPRSGLNGEWIPPYWGTGVAFNFAHRVGAVFVTLAILALFIQVFVSARKEPVLFRPACWLVFLLLAQIGLGAHIILKLRPPTLTTLHVLNGAIILATSVLLAVRASRLAIKADERRETPGISNRHQPLPSISGVTI
ncbi:MAG: COX15/CtaA family protein [Chthoniobacteraceae bacterium]